MRHGLVDQLVHGVTKLCVPFFNKFLHRRRGERWGESESVPGDMREGWAVAEHSSSRIVGLLAAHGFLEFEDQNMIL